MKELSRRKAIGALAAGGAGLALGSWVEAKAANLEVQAAAPLAFRGRHEPQPLPFDPAKLKGISERLIRSHWENNYGGSVKALNAVEQRLDAMLKEKDLPAYVYGDLKREELLRTGSVVLHENYFGNLGGNGKAGGEVLSALKQWFGSYEQWEAEFKKTASALSGGSGWAILTYNFHNGEVHNYWAWDHMHNVPTGQPLLVLDMYEHSYQMDYGAAAAKYIDAFMDNVDWEAVNRRFVRAQKASAALRA
ncbi:MAG TPA: Fe-Mn family superoxide dismutase [Pyrinomonadaceae bacterium]|nr:Fe-Mn family superoxide dismutase [Pyrinomonadaceae bacterium]